ncbi:MAG: hypothetical protein JSR98_10045, partial [Proteobacteria bacterium]|nr:hypothetical protein [Pseudomonadota bacterium]
QAGYDVTIAADPRAALDLYDAGETFHLIMADTSNGSEARAFAEAFQGAERWHRTPMLSLATHRQLNSATGPESVSLLDAVAGALGEMRGAA